LSCLYSCSWHPFLQTGWLSPWHLEMWNLSLSTNMLIFVNCRCWHSSRKYDIWVNTISAGECCALHWCSSNKL
jgi:hypothetical protein